MCETVTELIAAVKALPVDEIIEVDYDGNPTLVGYAMQAQGEWDRVLQALRPFEPAPLLGECSIPQSQQKRLHEHNDE